jgi:chaperonin cofactor prefoldin
VVFLGNKFIGGCDDLMKFGSTSEGRIEVLHREVDILRSQYDKIRLQIQKLVKSS